MQIFAPSMPIPWRRIVSYSLPTDSAFLLAAGPARGTVTMSWSPKGRWTAFHKTEVRNKIIFGVASAIDASYRNFSDGFYVKEGTINTMLDVILIGLGSSGTLAGGAAFKAILAATSTGITGSRLAFAKNF